MTNRVAVNPQILFGKPCVAGTRILMQNVLEPVRENLSLDDVIRDYYSDLEPDNIRACVHFSKDNEPTLP